MSESTPNPPPPEDDLSVRYTILRTTKEGPVHPRNVAGQCAREITRELKRLKQWMDPPPPLPEFRAPFGMDVMPFTMWIQLILVPRLDAIEQGKAEIPRGSMLAAHAVREFDGDDQYQNLIDLLHYVDDLTGGLEELDEYMRPIHRPPPLPKAATALLMLAVSVAGVLGFMGAQEIDAMLLKRAPVTLLQRVEGLPAPTAGFQSAIADLSFEVSDDGSLRPEAMSIVMPRALREMNKGMIKTLELRPTDKFDRAALDEWFRFHDIDPTTSASERTAQSIEHIVDAMRNTTRREQLPTLATGTGVVLGSAIDLEPRLSERVEGIVLVISLLLTTVPTLLILVRILRAKERRKLANPA